MRKPENQKHERRVVRDEIRTSASPQKAWEAWADPEKIAGWFVDRATGKAEAGSAFTWFFDSFHLELPYTVLEAEPGTRFALRWEGPMPPPGILEIIIEREGGETLIRLVQSGFREDAQFDEEYEGVRSGWQNALGLLRHYLENYFGEQRKTVLVMQPGQFSYADLDRYYRNPALLAEWLTVSPRGPAANDGAIGEVGEACELELRGGGKLTGQVLARTDHEVALSWPEERATLELKSFSMGPQKMLGLRASLWGATPERAKKIEVQMSESLERLAGLLKKPARAGAC